MLRPPPGSSTSPSLPAPVTRLPSSYLLLCLLDAVRCSARCSQNYPWQNLVAQSCAPERKETCLWLHRQKQSQEELECPQAMIDTSPCRHTVGTHRGLCRCHWSNQTPSPSAAGGGEIPWLQVVSGSPHPSLLWIPQVSPGAPHPLICPESPWPVSPASANLSSHLCPSLL